MRLIRPTIFLDIDGVLNTPRTPGFQTPKGKIDPTLVNNLNLIAGAFQDGINIVISSHWRVWHSLADIKIMLQDAGLSNKAFVIGKTDDDYRDPHLSDDDVSGKTIFIPKTRGDEIRDWLLDNPDVNAYGQWAIIDDNNWMNKNQLDRFVKTDPMVGLTPANAGQVIRILMTKKLDI